MSSNATTILGGSAVLSPLDPLVFLSAEEAIQSMYVRYVCAGTAGAFIWETLINLGDNYHILLQHQIRLPTVVSWVSTITSMAYVIGNAVFSTAPIPSCLALKRSLQVLYVISIPSTSLLFFFRTRAVFHKEPWVVLFFACMWLAVVVSSLTPMLVITAENIGPTSYCINTEMKQYAIMAAIIPLLNDTLNFVAISWRLRCNSSARQTIKDGVRVLIFGDYLPALSKTMLQDGQVYYLSTIASNLVTVIFLHLQTIPPALQVLPRVPNAALMSMMACRVFRKTIMGLPRRNDISASLISREMRAIHSVIGLGDSSIKFDQNAVDISSVTDEQTHDRATDDCINISAMV